MNRRKIIFVTILLVTLVLFLDFSPMIYYRMCKNSAAWANYYNYDITSPKKLLYAIKKIDSKTVQVIQLESINDKSHYLHFVFKDLSNSGNYECFVLFDTITLKDFSQIVFSNFFSAPDHKDSKDINLNYDFITSYFITKKFESLVIDKLDGVTLTGKN